MGKYSDNIGYQFRQKLSQILLNSVNQQDIKSRFELQNFATMLTQEAALDIGTMINESNNKFYYVRLNQNLEFRLYANNDSNNGYLSNNKNKTVHMLKIETYKQDLSDLIANYLVYNHKSQPAAPLAEPNKSAPIMQHKPVPF